MRSMTGFAATKATIIINQTQVYVTMSLKSVNARFLETTCKFPYAIHYLETDFIKLLKDQLIRGNVTLIINFSDQTALRGSITPSIPIAQSYATAAQQIQKETGISGTFTISDLINLPHIFSVEEQFFDDQLKNQFTELLQKTTRILIVEQEKEGSALHKDLAARIALVTTLITEIETLHEAFMAQRKKEILGELQSYTKDDVTIEARKAALYYLLDKIDIHEEIIRTKSHLASIEQLLSSNTIEMGKRLDFTLQELGREINTIAAKCSDATMGARAIDIKVELEKAREQAQNIV